MISSLAIYLSGLRKEFKLSANIKYAVPLHDTCIPVVIFLRLMKRQCTCYFNQDWAD